ncbi:inorganic phosphate transporter [Xaviernesmea oryzae]|uniref:Phosphate transporter n=1 Tax=Xaviernesmea oryzae TaxID=464029 RepID=A0A1Q9ARY3_9HYPH|nr:inorganic phosphate transporter [Xaviernesmea oryzae]OLP58055.1 inorganic phosphate transporter [Xaviernesmea oryzae]SEL84161.1 inorganic phosphate transporter, PiT family [Xaviernesmea oryzae]
MGKHAPVLEKPTLDKELDKLMLAEQAVYHVRRSSTWIGFAAVFLLISALFAYSYTAGQPGTGIIIAAAAMAAYMAMNIGANDVTNNVGAAVGAKAISMRTALMIAAVFEIAGAVFAGGRITSTIESGIVHMNDMPSRDTFIWVMMAALTSAAICVNIATWSSAAISTTHSVVGGILGAGIAAAGFGTVNWVSLASITASWVVTPFLGGGIAALLLAFMKIKVFYREDRMAAAGFWIPIVIALMIGTFTVYFALICMDRVARVPASYGLAAGLTTGLATYLLFAGRIRQEAMTLDDNKQALRRLFRVPLILSAALLSFAHGANDVSNAIGPLSAIVSASAGFLPEPYTVVPLWVTLIGALGISLGLSLYGPKLIYVVGVGITKLNPMRAFCVALATALTVLLAVAIRIPVSTTHTAVGAVFGIGFFREWFTRNSQLRVEFVRRKTGQSEFRQRDEPGPDETQRRRLVRRSHFMTMAAAWVVTVPASGLLAALLYLVFRAVF